MPTLVRIEHLNLNENNVFDLLNDSSRNNLELKSEWMKRSILVQKPKRTILFWRNFLCDCCGKSCFFSLIFLLFLHNQMEFEWNSIV